MGKQWTVKDENVLREMVTAGNSLRDMAKVLGRTTGAITSRVTIMRKDYGENLPRIARKERAVKAGQVVRVDGDIKPQNLILCRDLLEPKEVEPEEKLAVSISMDGEVIDTRTKLSAAMAQNEIDRANLDNEKVIRKWDLGIAFGLGALFSMMTTMMVIG